MVRSMRIFLCACAALTLAACSPADNEPGPGGVTVGEARALDEAAAMIEAKRLPQQAEGGPGNEDAETIAPDSGGAAGATPPEQ
jgi:hypothetical protein